ncbi:hypothetical protein PIB30_058385 [Stylosanthes scabra]|uniref:Uncharacterized protein n=1 Tax=Stylosanthes scabra TaxID=79078 RepID=A0ABU6YJA1_9FABA|nr:hypothetical protein [Stylosanthes scabra]
MYALALKGKTSPKLLTTHSIDFISNSIAWSFIPRGNDTHLTVVLLVRFGALADIGAYHLSIKAELLISHHISAAAESKEPNKRLPFTGVFYRLLFANGFKKKVQGDKLIPIEKPITA